MPVEKVPLSMPNIPRYVWRILAVGLTAALTAGAVIVATTNPANHAQENLRLEMSQAPE
tara:strand:- start:611 stop:787 length:177 start_codon:yes stop_codon:yes gene_type:complete